MSKHRARWLIGAGSAIAIGSLVAGTAVPALGATASPAHHSPGAVYKPVHAVLRFGMRGPDILALQHRLHYLHYFVGKINGWFTWDTQEAVWAFKEVQTGKIVPPDANKVDARTQRWLVHPRRPRVLYPSGGSTRVEINKAIEVLVLYSHDKVKLISHVSSAAYCRPPHHSSCGWFTPPGQYKAEAYIPGKVPDRSFGTSYMYWPVFFIGTTYAIHGFPNPKWGNRWYGVPLKPASHGCVRIPLDLSKEFHKMVHISPSDGTPVWIYPDTAPPGPQVRVLQPGNAG
jgi:lipoprotein-anchoring transpeptidase ErfK/SrfK